jgi:hypothetical protein
MRGRNPTRDIQVEGCAKGARPLVGLHLPGAKLLSAYWTPELFLEKSHTTACAGFTWMSLIVD